MDASFEGDFRRLIHNIRAELGLKESAFETSGSVVDLPWNPTKQEQRIGRIKRFGQTRTHVDMLNLVYRDTVDEKICERLSERMKDRFDIIGSLPDTIIDDWIENEALIGQKMDEYIGDKGIRPQVKRP